ncbi:MAG: hypothetical protein GF363_01155, partial [Chitinivibrionales bacterium]|nr:hypothetical protein [Chitinivibrionales bacterium]
MVYQSGNLSQIVSIVICVILLGSTAAPGDNTDGYDSGTEGAFSDWAVNIGLVDVQGLPGTEVEVPVVMVNHTDEGVVYCRFELHIPRTSTASFVGISGTSNSWDIAWDSSTVESTSSLRNEATYQPAIKVIVEARARSVQHLYGRLELTRLVFAVGGSAQMGRSVQLGVAEAEIHSRNGVLISRTNGGKIGVGEPISRPSPLNVLACAVSDQAQCEENADLSLDGRVSLEDAILAIVEGDGLGICVQSAPDRCKVLLQGSNEQGSSYPVYRLRIVGAEGLLGLRVQFALNEKCRIVSETATLRGGYALGVQEELNVYTVAMVSSDPVVTNDTVDVLSFKTMGCEQTAPNDGNGD